MSAHDAFFAQSPRANLTFAVRAISSANSCLQLLSSGSSYVEGGLQKFVHYLNDSRRSFVRALKLQNLHAFFINRNAAKRLPSVLELRKQSVVFRCARLRTAAVGSNGVDQVSILVSNGTAAEYRIV